MGRLLFSAAGVFVRDKLVTAQGSDFGPITQVHMALIQNLDLGGTRLTRIAARAGMTKQSMQDLVDKAEALGFVERRADPDDRRAKTVVFTQAGLVMMERLRQGILMAERRMVDATGAAFMAEMKDRLAAYVAEGTDDGELLMSEANAEWRMRNAGRVLVAAFGVYNRDVLRAVHQGGFDAVSEAHLTLFRNLDLGGTRPTEIAARARITKQAVAELVSKVEALGLVTRAPDADDGRAKMVALTASGLQVVDRLGNGLRRADRRLAAVTGKAFFAELQTKLAAYVASDETSAAAAKIRIRMQAPDLGAAGRRRPVL